MRRRKLRGCDYCHYACDQCIMSAGSMYYRRSPCMRFFVAFISLLYFFRCHYADGFADFDCHWAAFQPCHFHFAIDIRCRLFSPFADIAAIFIIAFFHFHFRRRDAFRFLFLRFFVSYALMPFFDYFSAFHSFFDWWLLAVFAFAPLLLFIFAITLMLSPAFISAFITRHCHFISSMPILRFH